MKIKPIRTCVFTRQKDFKENLIRLVSNEVGIYVLDKSMKEQKRGIYLSKTNKVLKLLGKHKKYNISEDAQKEIVEIIERTKVDDIFE